MQIEPQHPEQPVDSLFDYLVALAEADPTFRIRLLDRLSKKSVEAKVAVASPEVGPTLASAVKLYKRKIDGDVRSGELSMVNRNRQIASLSVMSRNLPDQPLEALGYAALADAVAKIKDRQSSGLAPDSIQTAVRDMRLFFGWLEDSGQWKPKFNADRLLRVRKHKLVTLSESRKLASGQAVYSPSDLALLYKAASEEQRLYTLLWQNAAYKVAAAHGISYPSLLRICTQHQIPRPPRAYWIMVAKGRFVDRPPLPQVSNDADQLIEIVPDEKLTPTTPLPPLKSEPLPVVLKPSQVAVPDTLFSPLPLVKRTIFCLRAGTPGDDGIIRLNNHKGCLDVAVSRRQIPRTMRFLDTFFKAAMSRGMTVRTELFNGKECTLISVGNADIQFRLWEMCNGLGNQRRARGDFFLTLDGKGASHRDWNDSDGKPLENQIGKILDAAGRMAERMRLWEREWEQRDRVYAEEKRLREEAAAIRAEQNMRESQLKKLIKCWQKAQSVRMFIDAVESKAGAVDPTTELGQWIEWARKHASKLDPLTDPIEGLPRRCRDDLMAIEGKSHC